MSSEMAVSLCNHNSNEWEFLLSQASSSFGVVHVPYLTRRCVVVPHCCLNSHFPDDIGCRASFHMFICHHYSFFVSCVLKSLAHFSIKLFVSLLLSFKCYLYFGGDNSFLADVSFANIFSISMASLVILLIIF